MPKQQGSGSIARRTATRNEQSSGANSVGVDGILEMIHRVNNRIERAQTVNVEVSSRTRGREENLRVVFDETPGMAHVYSASGSVYTVDYITIHVLACIIELEVQGVDI